MTLCYHLGDLFHRLPLPLLDVLHDQLVKHLLLDVVHDHLVTHPLLDVLHDHLVKHLLPILDVLHELYVEKAKKSAPKKEKKLGVVVVLLANVFFGGWEMSEFGGGKCPPGK